MPHLLLDLPEPPLDVIPEVLRGLGQEGLQVTLGILLFEVVELLESHLGELLLSDLLKDLDQGLVVTLGELRHPFLLSGDGGSLLRLARAPSTVVANTIV